MFNSENADSWKMAKRFGFAKGSICIINPVPHHGGWRFDILVAGKGLFLRLARRNYLRNFAERPGGA